MSSNGALTLLVILGFCICASAQLQSSVERPCPGETVTFTCTLSSTAHNWNIPSLGITRSLTAASQRDGVISVQPFEFNVTEVVPGTSITSIAIVNTANLNGTLVVCADGNLLLPDQSITINLKAPPAAPETPSVTFPIPRQQFNITWNEPPMNIGETIDTYFVNISGPDNLCGNVNTFQNVTEPSYTCSGWTMPTGQMYIFTVAAANCGGSLRGPYSEPVTVTLQAPNPPTLTATPLYNSSGGLLEIESQATERLPVTIADGVDSSPTEYIFSYNGSPISVSTGSTPQCTSSSCQHAFRVTSSQVQQYAVSVAARNVVGVGTASTPVTVDFVNTVFNVTVDIGVRVVTCQFLNGPVTSATCTIQYGTDPTYVNLPNTDSSTATNVNNVTVPLSAPLQADTFYYYVVSSIGVRMQGTFSSGCTLADLGVVGTTADEQCVGLQNSAQFSGGVVCYSGVIPGSLAVYVCNSSHHLEGPRFRECQSNGNWSGTVPQCVADTPTDSQPVTASLGAGTIVGISITIFLVSFSAGALLAALITYCCCVRRREKSSGQPHPSPSEGPQPAPLYDEVIAGKLEVKENVAYGPVDALEMKKNPSYGPVRH